MNGIWDQVPETGQFSKTNCFYRRIGKSNLRTAEKNEKGADVREKNWSDEQESHYIVSLEAW